MSAARTRPRSILELLPERIELPPVPASPSNSPLTSIGSPEPEVEIPPIQLDAPVQGSSKDLEAPAQPAEAPSKPAEAAARTVQPFKVPPRPLVPTIAITPAQLMLKPVEQPSTQPRKPFELPVWSMPPTYMEDLPDLPPDLLRNRAVVGGLIRKKKERDERATGLSGGMELYRLGVSRATHAGVRHLMGQGQADGKSKAVRPGKVIFTADWNVAVQELQGLRALERIEQLKAQNAWSFRQIRKQKMPQVAKTHWDYLLDEMVCLVVLFFC
jgi:hypothetical protein